MVAELVRRWNLMEELAQRVQQLETQVGQQRAVVEHQEELADATTNESSTDSS